MRVSSAPWRDVELCSPFDALSAPAYLLIGVVTLTGLCICFSLGFSISPAILPQYFGAPLMSVLGGWGLRRLGHPKFGSAMEALGLSFVQGLAGFLLIAPLAALSLPLADATLASADRALGFDWPAYARLVNGPVAGFFYRSFGWQTAVTALAVFLSGQRVRGWRFVMAAVIAMIICALLFPLAPAVGAAAHFGIEVRNGIAPFAPALLALKGGHRVLDDSVFTGLISFPSYHAAAAVLFTWACWTTRLRWPVLLLNIGMTASAITIGSHYFVDILGGLATGAAAIYLASLPLWGRLPVGRGAAEA